MDVERHGCSSAGSTTHVNMLAPFHRHHPTAQFDYLRLLRVHCKPEEHRAQKAVSFFRRFGILEFRGTDVPVPVLLRM